jgi:hypothetical protein
MAYYDNIKESTRGDLLHLTLTSTCKPLILLLILLVISKVVKSHVKVEKPGENAR